MTSKFYETPEYYRELLKDYYQNLIKSGKVHDLGDLRRPIHYLRDQGYDLSPEDEEGLLGWADYICNFAQLGDLLESYSERSLEEVIIHNNSWTQVIGPERHEFFVPCLSQEDFEFALLILAQRHGLLWNQASPFLCFQSQMFQKEWRVTLVHKSLCNEGSSKIFFRQQADKKYDLSCFGITEGQRILLKECLNQKKNMLICGATGSGKTTFLKGLLREIPEREHLITLEDTPELDSTSPFTTKLVSNGEKPDQLKDFCHYALRMRPDRLVLGEIRSAEVVPFLLSINTGHGGMMTSLHANSALDSLHRLCLLFQVYSQQMNVGYHDVMRLVCQGIDFVCYLENKKVVSILEIKGCEGMTPYYEVWA